MEKKYGEGYKKYEPNAKAYLNSPEKTETLLRDARRKADEKKGSLTDVWDKLQLLFQLTQSWRIGEYRKIPKGSIISIIAAAFIYFVSPIDLVPDFLVGFGIIDDAAVIGFVIKQISKDLEKYRLWKESSFSSNQIIDEAVTE